MRDFSSIGRVLALSALALALGCATSAARLTRLNDTELTALLHDVSIETDPPVEDATEVFFANGGYQVWGRGGAGGRYVIENERVCVTTARPIPIGAPPAPIAPPLTNCRMIVRDGAGTLFFARTEPFVVERATRFHVVPVQSGTEPANQSFRRLQNIELRRVIVGNSVSTMESSDPEHIVIARRETFARDGWWRQIGDRVAIQSHFVIQNDEVCVERQHAEPLCRAMFVDNARRYFWGARSKGAPDPRGLIEVVIAPCPDPASCLSPAP